MERYSSRTIDELGRIVLHSELRKKLNMETNDKLCLQLVDTLLVLKKSESKVKEDCNICLIDELGRIILPEEFRAKLYWGKGDKIAVYNTDNIIILKSTPTDF